MQEMQKSENAGELKFITCFRGYDVKQVDACFDELIEKIKNYEKYIRHLQEMNNQLKSEKIDEYNEYLDNAKELAQKKIKAAEQEAQAIIAQAKESVLAAERRLQQIELKTNNCVAEAKQNIIKVIALSGQIKQNIDRLYDDAQNNSNQYLNVLNQISLNGSTEFPVGRMIKSIK